MACIRNVCYFCQMLLFLQTSAYDIGTVADIGNLYYTKQSDAIGNACGTVALVHALANNADKITFDGEIYQTVYA